MQLVVVRRECIKVARAVFATRRVQLAREIFQREEQPEQGFMFGGFIPSRALAGPVSVVHALAFGVEDVKGKELHRRRSTRGGGLAGCER